MDLRSGEVRQRLLEPSRGRPTKRELQGPRRALEVEPTRPRPSMLLDVTQRDRTRDDILKGDDLIGTGLGTTF